MSDKIGVLYDWSIEDKSFYFFPVPIGAKVTVLYAHGRWETVEADDTLNWGLDVIDPIVGYVVHNVPNSKGESDE